MQTTTKRRRYVLKSHSMLKLRKVFTFPTGILFLIVTVSFIIRVANLNYNSPFLDEAIYLTLGKQVLSWQWQPEDPYAWVGGNPLFYPTLSAIFGFLGGIVGSRFLSVILGTFSVYLMYQFGRMLKLASGSKVNEIIGLTSAAFLGILAMPVFLSRWAIYDMLSFSLFLLGLVFLQRALNVKKADLWEREGKYFVVAVAFFLSFLAKYITLILFPIVLLWAFIKSKELGKESLSVAIRYFMLPLIGVIGFYFFRYMDDLLHFQREQVSTTSYSTEQIVTQFLIYALPAIVIALGGLVILLLRKQLKVSLYLVAASAVVPVVHVITNNFASVNQHSFLSIVFLLPLGAYLFTKMYERHKLIGSIVTFSALLVVSLYSQGQVRQLENMWTNTNDVMAYLQENTTSHERVLTTEGDIAAVALENIKNENIVGQYYFNYKNNETMKAYSNAVRDSYFDFVVIDSDSTNEVSKTIKTSLTNHYSPEYNKHPFTVYKKGL